MREQILALRAEGKSYREIQQLLGCSKGTIAYHCSDVQKQKTKARAKERRIKQFAEIAKLKDVPCTDCGNRFPPECMDFDHVSDDKLDKVAHLVTCRGFQVALDEIKKCEVVCANCHRTRTKNRGSAAWNRKIKTL